MKALLITAETQTIEAVEIVTMADIKKLIGYDTIESDQIGSDGNYLYFDEECFLRGSKGRFQIDTMIPVSGTGIIVGTVDDGAAFKDVTIGVDELRQRIKYL
ncbi:MAG: hypothetical protein OEY29_06635 [Gammaproteobacteria bacterium]|nr:hypothetical protein [Gammaproteobacteria bacterium]